MSVDFDVCVIGSGAGGSPVAYSLSKAGYSVCVLEKGPWFRNQDYCKDELAVDYYNAYITDQRDEPQVVEEKSDRGDWERIRTDESKWNFWNGSCVGGGTNFMSGFFYRLKPVDFRLLSEFGPIPGANIADWPITYQDLEPYYALAEYEIGISGRVTAHRFSEPRSTSDYPFPPTAEHPVSRWIDRACHDLGFTPLPIARAILPFSVMDRKGCSYSGYCGGFGCSTGAKGSSRVALLDRAVKLGNCQVKSQARARRLITNRRGNQVSTVEFMDPAGRTQRLSARIFVVACQAIETARLLLLSTGPAHPQGLGNRHGLVGQNLISVGGGGGSGRLLYAKLPEQQRAELRLQGPFVNRGLQDWYVIEEANMGRQKGGTIDFLFSYPGVIDQAVRQTRREDKWVWGTSLKERLRSHFQDGKTLQMEVFCDWLPTRDCFVTLDSQVKDAWGIPVARIRLGYHPHDLRIAQFLVDRGEQVFHRLGAESVRTFVSGDPSTNLMGGTCRFGKDPDTSVLDTHCRVHDVDNLYVTDGSFMPTGGSVPFTWTIYANAFRVADHIRSIL
jgi:choline dehydrogenase-like flavoprotein